MDSGYVEFKCHGCGKFASTDTYKKPNEPENFGVMCDNCNSTEWSGNIQDVDHQEEDTNMECSGCKGKQFEFTPQ